MNTIITSSVLSLGTAYTPWTVNPTWNVAESCDALALTCNGNCGEHAVFPDCKNRGGSCTPYSFMPNIDNQDCSWMDSYGFSSWPFLQYSNEYSYQAFAAKKDDGSFYDDIWILHGCDGAGIQTDCHGDIFYLEHFGSRHPVAYNEDCPMSEYGKTHKPCPTFYHPGKSSVYKDYTCGWWRGYEQPTGVEQASNDGVGAFKPAGDGGDYSASMRSILSNCPTCNHGSALVHPYKDHKENGQAAFAYFTGALWPWICNPAGHDAIAYTGKEVKCYCDNEPHNGRWSSTPTYPQGTQIVYCGLYQHFAQHTHATSGPVLLCDFITLNPSTNEAVANQRGVRMYPTNF